MTVLINYSDFAVGLFCALRLRNLTSLGFRGSGNDWWASMAAAYDKLEELAFTDNLECDFRIKVHPFHDDSEIAQRCLDFACSLRLVSTDSHFAIVRWHISKRDAEWHLKRMHDRNQIPIKIWDPLAEAFLDRFEHRSPASPSG